MAHPAGGAWRKAPAALADQFSASLAELPGAALRQMFGYPAAFANGHMFTGLHQDRWVIRLPDAARSELAGAGAIPFEPMPGRPMREYLVLPESLVNDPDALRPWLERALAHVASLPPKEARR
ncbi:MAG TPA: TfoX/Sxy family protein [Candidatus Limnocylindria bacterium]|nr:TfoX/Sxy family protein [Candidatus Limnocylindria bacterium]